MPQLIRKSHIHEENVHIESITLYTNDSMLDITTVFDGMTIEEDIELGFCRGTIRFIDTFSGNKFSLTGLDLLDISFTSVDKDFNPVDFYKKRFRVAHYESNRSIQTGRYDIVTLHFVSNPAIENESIRLSKSYNTSNSDFVKECCRTLGVDDADMEIEETLHVNHFIAPRVTPLEMINWIKVISTSKETNGSDFYFFENRDGVKFKSLDALKSAKINEKTHTLVYKPNVGGSELSYNLILDYSKPKGYNVRDDIKYGGIGTSVYTHDLITKAYSVNEYRPNSVQMLNTVNQKPEEYENNVNAFPQFWSHNNIYSSMDLNSVGHSAAIRSVSKTKVNFKCMNIQIPGNVDIKSGDCVLISVSSIKPDEESGSASVRIDESGKWLVKKVRHVLSRENFFTDLEVVTDGNINEIKK